MQSGLKSRVKSLRGGLFDSVISEIIIKDKTHTIKHYKSKRYSDRTIRITVEF